MQDMIEEEPERKLLYDLNFASKIFSYETKYHSRSCQYCLDVVYERSVSTPPPSNPGFPGAGVGQELRHVSYAAYKKSGSPRHMYPGVDIFLRDFGPYAQFRFVTRAKFRTNHKSIRLLETRGAQAGSDFVFRRRKFW